MCYLGIRVNRENEVKTGVFNASADVVLCFVLSMYKMMVFLLRKFGIFDGFSL